MRRMLLCLPLLCLVMAPDNLPPARCTDKVVFEEVKDDGKQLPKEDEMVRLAKTDPIEFMTRCINRYDREVTGYRTNFKKQERIKDELRPSEEIAVDFKEKPFSVLFHYAKPDKAKRVLYLKPADFSEKNHGKLIVQTAGVASAFVSIVERDPHGPDARASSRYTIDGFGIKVGSLRTLEAWKEAKKENALHIEFLGEKKIPELNNRVCWVLKRVKYARPEEDGITELTIYVEKETWLQTGSVVKDKDGRLIGEYLFRDVELNPKFDDDTFTRKSLQKK